MTVHRVIARFGCFYEKEGVVGVLVAVCRKMMRPLRDRIRRARWRSRLRSDPAPQVSLGSVRLELDPLDVGLSSELAIEGTHEPLCTRIYLEFLKPGMLVVDVGANIGYFALLAAERVGPSGKVVALEPAPRAFQFLAQNVGLNNLANIELHNVAAGNTMGSAELSIFPEANWNTFLPVGRTTDRSVLVPMVRLDDYLCLDGRIDAVRLDVEGYEGHVLAGMQRILVEDRPTIFLELHGKFLPPGERSGLITALDSWGYTTATVFPRDADEVFFGRSIARPARIIEEIPLTALLEDRRLTAFGDNFCVVMSTDGRGVASSVPSPRFLRPARQVYAGR